MADDIEVIYDQRSGYLSLSCNAEGFARLRDLVASQPTVTEMITGPVSTIQVIEITEKMAARPFATIPDRVALWGCGLMCGLLGFVLMFIFVIGVGTIIGWMR